MSPRSTRRKKTTWIDSHLQWMRRATNPRGQDFEKMMDADGSAVSKPQWRKKSQYSKDVPLK